MFPENRLDQLGDRFPDSGWQGLRSSATPVPGHHRTATPRGCGGPQPLPPMIESWVGPAVPAGSSFDGNWPAQPALPGLRRRQRGRRGLEARDYESIAGSMAEKSSGNSSEDHPNEADYRRWKRDYLRAWTKWLKALLGWPEDRTLEWAKRYSSFLESDDPQTLGCFYHQPAELYIGFLLINELRVGPAVGPERSSIARRLAFVGMRGFGPTKNVSEYDDDDWAEARERVRAILKDYGADLPPSSGVERQG